MSTAAHPVSGLLDHRYPYVRFGAGPHALVILPGLTLDNPVPGPLTTRAYAHAFRRLTRTHTVHIIHRGYGLPSGATTRDIADEYASLLAGQVGPARVMGLSTGGLVAQHLAIAHPHLVERLVLVVTGARLSPRGRDICRRWRGLAGAGRWRRLRGDLAAIAFDGAGTQRLARLAGSLNGGAPSEVEQADFLATVDAVIDHDTRATLAGLATPTLLVGGAEDPFFPASALRETAAAAPQVALRVYERTGHGLPKRHARRLTEDAYSFLSG